MAETNWEDELHWFYHRADGELGVRGIAYEPGGVPVAPHERSSPARDSRPGEETSAEKDARIKETLASMPSWGARILQRYYAWEPNRAQQTIQDRRVEAVERLRMEHLRRLLERGNGSVGKEQIARVLANAHADYRSARRQWRLSDAEARRKKREAERAYLRGERVIV